MSERLTDEQVQRVLNTPTDTEDGQYIYMLGEEALARGRDLAARDTEIVKLKEDIGWERTNVADLMATSTRYFEERNRAEAALAEVQSTLKDCQRGAIKLGRAGAERIKTLKNEIAQAMTVLKPNMPESGLVDACRQVKQVAIAEADNCNTLEALVDQLRTEKKNLGEALRVYKEKFHQLQAFTRLAPHHADAPLPPRFYAALAAHTKHGPDGTGQEGYCAPDCLKCWAEANVK